MIDHLTLRVRDFDASKAFYSKVLKPLGYEVLMEFDFPGSGKFCGMGVKGKPDFWLAPQSREHPAATGQHIAFRAERRAQIDDFHRLALQAGAKDDGKPGPRPHYHANYYGAFVVDLNGVHIEACSHDPE